MRTLHSMWWAVSTYQKWLQDHDALFDLQIWKNEFKPSSQAIFPSINAVNLPRMWQGNAIKQKIEYQNISPWLKNYDVNNFDAVRFSREQWKVWSEFKKWKWKQPSISINTG